MKIHQYKYGSHCPRLFATTAIIATVVLFFSGAMTGTLVWANEPNLLDRQQKAQTSLQALQEDIQLTDSQKNALEVEIAKLENDRAALNTELIDTARQERSLEDEIRENEEKLTRLFIREQDLSTSLDAKSDLLAEVLGALQRLGRKPPPALLVMPSDALQSIRSATLLGSVIPHIREETEILLSELTELNDVKQQLQQTKIVFSDNQSQLAQREQKLTLLLREKRKLTDGSREKLVQENAKAARLAAKARTLQELIGSLESEITKLAEAAEAARKLESEHKQQQQDKIALARKSVEDPTAGDSERMSPAIAITNAKGLLPKPVSGVEITRYGQAVEDGIKSPSIAFATRANARVISPADGWVVYSGPFRTYGQLLILNVGSDHHIVMSGLAKINVSLGQFVLRGEPVGNMGAQRIASATPNNVGLARPVLNIEFRHNGEPVDPAPWWQANTNQRANNDS